LQAGAVSFASRYTYYNLAVFKFAKLSLDYQFVGHPAYNRDRGPVSIFGFRAHGEF
jgi:high affinity Mn2+ porin